MEKDSTPRSKSPLAVDAEAPTSIPPPLVTFPEGGSTAWITVFGAWLALFSTFGLMNAFGSFQLYYQEHQLKAKSPSDISWIGSLQLWMFFFSGSVIGRIFDAQGPFLLLVVGTLVYTFSIMMTSLASQYYQFVLAQGILFGLGVGMLFYASLSAVSTHFLKYRATTVGIAVAGSSVGGVVFPIMLQRLFNVVGFGWAVRISGFVCLGCCIVTCLTVKSRLPKRKPGPWVDWDSFKDLTFMLLAVGSGTVCFGIFIPFFYIVQYAQDHGLSQQLAFGVLSVMNAGSVFGRVLPSYAADVVGRFNLIIPFAFLSGVFTLALWLNSTSSISLMFFAAIYGFFSGAFISVNTPCVAQISEITKIGTRIGMFYTILAFPSLVGGPIAGAILTRQHGKYSGMIVYAGVAMILGSAIMLLSKMRINSRLFAKV